MKPATAADLLSQADVDGGPRGAQTGRFSVDLHMRGTRSRILIILGLPDPFFLVVRVYTVDNFLFGDELRAHGNGSIRCSYFFAWHLSQSFYCSGKGGGVSAYFAEVDPQPCSAVVERVIFSLR